MGTHGCELEEFLFGGWTVVAYRNSMELCVYIYMYVCIIYIYILYTQSSKVGDRLGDPNFGFKGQGGIRPVVIVDPAGRGSQFSPKSIEVGMEPGKCLKFKDIFGIII